MYFLQRNIGLLLGIGTLILFKILQWFPVVAEWTFTRFIYKGVRFVYYTLLNWVPFPLIYLFFSLILFAMIRHFFRLSRHINTRNTFSFVINGIGYLLCIFYFTWGFNYARIDVFKQFGLKRSNPDSEFLYSELLNTEETLKSLRLKISEDESVPLESTSLPEDYKKSIMETQNNLLRYFNSPTFMPSKIRSLRPKGVLLHISTAGVYFPFALEGHLDDGLHPIEKPFVMAHELSHANAFTDEGECNFIGFITCVNSDNPFIAYSGWFEYMRYLFTTLRRNDPEFLKDKGYELPLFYVTDYKDIIETLNQYPDIMPKFRNLFYDQYLKAQGVHSGMKSYAEILKLAYSFKELKGSFDIEKGVR